MKSFRAQSRFSLHSSAGANQGRPCGLFPPAREICRFLSEARRTWPPALTALTACDARARAERHARKDAEEPRLARSKLPAGLLLAQDLPEQGL
ncbi:hypothetical protein AAFF_G00217860 [Aldrovandia affinis]|uniref:Uncharacterized protein n=1 Tax=Aldrovandia affinis TaxID=143900 RepID=A0AAD7SVT5_9TELE|nr:hypothetical protein AAFF_G00217860 [Aldrovandia affinis]